MENSLIFIVWYKSKTEHNTVEHTDKYYKFER